MTPCWIARYVTRIATLIVGLAVVLATGPCESEAQDLSRSAGQVFVLRGATVHTAVGPAVENATILIRDGLILAVGTDVEIPADARIVDVTGKHVIPGMMDNHSHIGFDIQDVNEPGLTFAPHYRITDVLSPDARHWNDAVEGGVTTIVTGPGSGSVSSGQAAVVKTWGPSLAERTLMPRGGLKIAMGRKRPDRSPSTSMAVTAFLRAQFIRAQEYGAALDRYQSGIDANPPDRNPALDVLVDVLRGETRVRSHVHSAHDILAILRLRDEFGFDLTLHHATEAYKVADEIARGNVPVVGLPLFVRIGLTKEVMESPAALVRRGILFAFHTDDPVVHSKHQRYNAALGIRYGMDELDALKAITVNPARIAGVDKRVGSIEPGKDADLVVIDGPWYELTSRIEMVFVDGMLAYTRSEEDAS